MRGDLSNAVKTIGAVQAVEAAKAVEVAKAARAVDSGTWERGRRNPRFRAGG
ncbi:hypothetical protein [Streptomyces olivochromogenes]|uniref:hypothetical protein n=1 Tax=Streptomyces olivochromogenes TaxID=1963 RepID=UPI003683E037